MGYEKRKGMKYLKLFENNIEDEFAITLLKEILYVIEPLIKSTKKYFKYEFYDEFIGHGDFDCEIFLKKKKLKTRKSNGYLDDNDIFEEIVKTDIEVDWDKLYLFFKGVVEKIPNLLPQYFTKAELLPPFSNSLYHITLKLTQDANRSQKVGLWDLKTKEK
jgi:hypothetical protein